MSEKDIENRLKKALDELGIYYIKVHGGQFQKAGIPDLLLCHNGSFIAIEIKLKAKTKLNPLQAFNMFRIRESGGLTFILHEGNYKSFLEDLKKEMNNLKN